MAAYHQNLKRKKRKGRKVNMKRKCSHTISSKHKEFASVKKETGSYKKPFVQISDADPLSQHLCPTSAKKTSFIESTPVSQKYLNQASPQSIPVSGKQQPENRPFKFPRRGRNSHTFCPRDILYASTVHTHTNRMLELEKAIPFMTKVKSRFCSQPDVYEKFILLLHIYVEGEEHGDAVFKGLLTRHLSEAELYVLVRFLFQEEEDLVKEFRHFLSDTKDDSVKTERTDTDVWSAEFLEALDKMKELLLLGHSQKLKTEVKRKYYVDTDVEEMVQNTGVGSFIQEATIPIENEETIVSHVMKMESQGYNYTVATFYELIIDVMSPVVSPNQNLAESLNEQNFVDISKLPIICYLKKQHPYLHIRENEFLTLECQAKMAVRHREQYFAELEEIFNKYGLQKRPEAIFCVDEVGVLLGARAASKVVLLKGRKMCRTHMKHKSMVSIAICGSAKGHCIPPFVVFKKNILCTSLLKGCIPGTAFTENTSGWMTARTTKNFLLHFQKCTSVKPNLLLYDPCTLHVTPSVLKQAASAGTILFPLPSRACCNGSILHPMSICFRALEESWRDMMDRELMDLGSHRPVTKYTVNRLLPYLYCLALLPVNIKTGFESAKIYPFHMNKVSRRKHNTEKKKGEFIEADAGTKIERHQTEVERDSSKVMFQHLEADTKEEALEQQYGGNMDLGISAYEEPKELITSSGRLLQHAEDSIKKEVTVVKCEPYDSDAGYFLDDTPVHVQTEIKDEPDWTVMNYLMTKAEQFHDSDGTCVRKQLRTDRQEKTDDLDPLSVMGDTQQRNKTDWVSSVDANKKETKLKEVVYPSVSSDFQPMYNLSAEIEHFEDFSMAYRCDDSQDTGLGDISCNKFKSVKQEKVPYLAMSYDPLQLERGNMETSEIRIICPPLREKVQKEESGNSYSRVAVTYVESAQEVKYQEDYNHSTKDPLFVDVKNIGNCNSDSTRSWITPGVDIEASCHHPGPVGLNTEAGDVEDLEAPTCDPLAFEFQPAFVHDPLQTEIDCKETSDKLSSDDLLIIETEQKENSTSTHSFVASGRVWEDKCMSGENRDLRKLTGRLEKVEGRVTQCSIEDRSVHCDRKSKSGIVNEPSEGIEQEEGKMPLVSCSQDASTLQSVEWLLQGKEQNSVGVKKEPDVRGDMKSPFVHTMKSEWKTVVMNDTENFKTKKQITGESKKTTDDSTRREPGCLTDGALSPEDKDDLYQMGPANEVDDTLICVDDDKLLLSDLSSSGQHKSSPIGNEHHCISCGKSVRNGASEGKRAHKGSIRDYPFQCVTCGKEFSYSIHLKLHQQRCMKCASCKKDQTGKNYITCESCGKTFKFSLDYKNHHSKCVYNQNSLTTKPKRFKILLRVWNRLQRKSNQKVRMTDNAAEMKVETEDLEGKVTEEHHRSDISEGKKMKTYLKLRNMQSPSAKTQ